MSVHAASSVPAWEARRLRDRRGLTLAVALIAASALVLRGYDLLALPIFNDEAVYLRWAADILDQRTRMALFIPVAEDGKQPLYIWLATAVMSVISDPLLAGRIVSVIAGLFSLAGIMLAGRWLQGRLVGLLAGAIYAVAPYTVFFDRMALADSVINMTAIWTFGLALLIPRRANSGRSSVLWGVALGLVMAIGVWTKLTAAFALPFPVLCLTLLPRKGRSIREGARSLVVAYVVFAAIASLLVVMPYAENQLRLTATHVFSSDELTVYHPVNVWMSNWAKYVSWIQAYLPAPLDWLVLIGAAWGLVFRTRKTLLLAACWIAIVLPSVVLARTFASRYLLDSIFPLIFLAVLPTSALLDSLRHRLGKETGILHGRGLVVSVAVVLAMAIGAPSLAMDRSLITDPASAAMPATDRDEYVEGWASGFGFKEALDLALQRAEGYDRDVFILSDHFQGLPFDGLALYIRRLPKIRHYVDARIAWGEDGIADTWRSHGVPLILVRNDGRGNTEAFEPRVPDAKLLGVFWKPGERKSFRVYEMDMQGTAAGR